MKPRTRIALFAIPAIIGFTAYILLSSRCAAAPNSDDVNTKKEAVVLDIMLRILHNAHFAPTDVNDAFSHKTFDTYLKRADFNKKIILQSDVDELKLKYYDKIDDQVLSQTFEFFNRSQEIFIERIADDKIYVAEALAQPFDFSVKESVELDPEKMGYAKDKTEMKENWRKYLKYQVMVRFIDVKKEQTDALNDEKNTDKTKATITTVSDSMGKQITKVKKLKSDVELEADARAKVKKTQDEVFERLAKVDRQDRMISYLNVVAGIFDPHTEFFNPTGKEDFDIAMTGQLEGIGATLQEKDGYIKVSSIVSGSPCWKQGQLKAGDLIIKAAQGDKEPVDMAGMRVEDAVKLIRGKKGTEVRLTVKKPDNSIIVIPIIRDVIILDETFAQSAIIDKDKKIGYIRLPGFYADFSKDKTSGRTCSEDVRKELEKLKAENVSGVILDLRDNGGGSLYEVIKMVGLFVPNGPVVQVKSRLQGVSVYDDKDGGAVVYDGPLVVLINENSASASEILAAAIQDYKRGVIVGSSSSSFGKGSVQNFFDLDDYPSQGTSSEMMPLGSVKVTIQKFYRINGGSTQLKGVVPDVQLPGYYSFDEQGEKDLDFPMPWDQIPAAPYKTWKNDPDYSKIKKNSSARVAASSSFTLVSQKSAQLKREKDLTTESLYLEDYNASREALKDENKKFKPLEEPIKGWSINMLAADKLVLQSDTSKMARKNDFLEKISKDPYINEAANIVKEQK
ncbi:MAG: carboxy terminal-processing peptidase [Bacteroidota bacterium]|nr:carboxy terminal-processing peptidase [Bacteroidota bacterium]